MDQLRILEDFDINGRYIFQVVVVAELTDIWGEVNLAGASGFGLRSISADVVAAEDVMTLLVCRALKAMNITAKSIAPIDFKCCMGSLIAFLPP